MLFKNTPKKTQDIKPLKRKGMGKLKLTGYILGAYLVFAGGLFTYNTTSNFINSHDFRTPIVFQNPIPKKDIKLISPVSTKSGVLIKKAYAEKPYSIDQDIKDVFGEHYDKAMILLKGAGCSENAKLNPTAVNTAGNYPQGSADVGVFQINDHWQGVSNIAFLKDPRINIRMAWNIYSRDGFSFKLWTCGRYHGI